MISLDNTKIVSETFKLKLDKFKLSYGHIITSDTEVKFKDIFGNEKFHSYFNLKYFKVEYGEFNKTGRIYVVIDPIKEFDFISKIDLIINNEIFTFNFFEFCKYPSSKFIHCKLYDINTEKAFQYLDKVFNHNLFPDIEIKIEYGEFTKSDNEVKENEK